MTSSVRPSGRGSGASAATRPLLDRTLVRLAFLIPGGVALIAGLNAALLLLELPAPLTFERLPAMHAPLMVFGFVGTVIVLERAIAARRGWGFVAPVLLSFGSIALLSPLPERVGKTMLCLGMALLIVVYLVIWRRQAAAATAIQVLGAVAGLSATILWLGEVGVPALIPGMTAFVVLTIAGERLELARVSPVVDARVERWGLVAALALATAASVAPLAPTVGYPLFALCLLALIAWLLRFDVATRLARSSGLPRYMAVCLLAGYGWLTVAAAIWLIAGGVAGGWAYDAVVHAVFLGFVMSMIMAHAPVILPAVLRKPLPYRPFFAVPAVLLHSSLALRLVGDATETAWAVQWGGSLNVAAILLFIVLAITSVLLGQPAPPAPKKAAP